MLPKIGSSRDYPRCKKGQLVAVGRKEVKF
jgi:hypothetical protein